MIDDRTQEAIEARQDHELLSLANEKGKFAIEVGYDDPAIIAALEHGFNEEWFTLIDVTTTVSAAPGRLMRVFRLTLKGETRRAELDLLFAR